MEPFDWNKLSEYVKKAINLNSFKNIFSSFLKTEWNNSILDFVIDKSLFFWHLHICCGLILCFCHEWNCLFILTFYYLKYYITMIKWTVYKNTFVFFSLCQASPLVLYRLVLSCIVSTCFFFLCKGCNKYQAFAFRCISSILCLWFSNDFGVIWFCIFDGNKTELNWLGLIRRICLISFPFSNVDIPKQGNLFHYKIVLITVQQ